MKNKLCIQKFIEEHDDWEHLLSEKPYCIIISHDVVFGRKLIMFKYSQIDSDFSIDVVRECRGLILDEDTFEPVCVPFFKFFNAGETHASNIDWPTAFVSQKLDGSLMKLTRLGNDILWSTNGTIDAFKAPLVEQIGCVAKSFGELAWWAMVDVWRKVHDLPITVCVDPGVVNQWLKTIIKPGYTYMFELTSPYNKIVVQWHETKLNFIGCRDNETFEELKFYEHEFAKIFNTPKIYPLKTLDDCTKAADALDVDEEGFVVCDKYFNRVKVKSAVYVSLHHMKNNGILSYERGIEIVRGNEYDEVIAYFPEFKEHLNKIRIEYDKLIARTEAAWEVFNSIGMLDRSRKDQAIYITRSFDIPAVGFSLLDKKTSSVKDWFDHIPAKSLIKHLGFKDV